MTTNLINLWLSPTEAVLISGQHIVSVTQEHTDGQRVDAILTIRGWTCPLCISVPEAKWWRVHRDLAWAMENAGGGMREVCAYDEKEEK